MPPEHVDVHELMRVTELVHRLRGMFLEVPGTGTFMLR